MEQVKYTDITRLGHKTTLDVLKEGDRILWAYTCNRGKDL